MKLRLSTKLIGLFLLLGLTPAFAIGLYSYHVSSEALRAEAFKQLLAIREMKKAEISLYFDNMKNQILTLSEDQMILTAMEELNKSFFQLEPEVEKLYDEKATTHEELLKGRYEYQKSHTANAPDNLIAQWWPRQKNTRILQHLYISSNPYAVGEKIKLDIPQEAGNHRYSKLHSQYHPILRSMHDKFGLDDVFLIEPKSGTIVYTVDKELDFATSLITGPFNKTNLAKAYHAAMESVGRDSVFLADFEPYAPSFNAPAAFLAAPIYRNITSSDKLGVLIFQLPISRLDALMTTNRQWEKVGLGTTGESFLVGPDYKFRSNSRFLIENPSLFFKQIKEAGVPDDVREKIKTFNSVIGLLEWKNPNVDETLAGQSHVSETTPDYRKKDVLLAHTPVTLPGGVTWALFSTLEEGEAFDMLFHLRSVMWVTGLICLSAVMAIGWFFARSISRPLNEVISIVSGSSAEIAATITQQERVSALQAASVNETNTTMEELGTSSRQSAEQAESAASSAQKAMEAAEHGMSRVEEMLQGMSSTKDKVTAIAQQILRLSEQTAQIGNITDTVTDFANETKMLAMNAAVEAVRAGEHGKGFSVLSVEIRKLAEESKRSAERINTLVNEIQKSTNTTVMVTEEGNKTVEQGMLIAQNTAEAFAEVAESIGNASQNSQQISLNVRQQSVAIRQVVEAMKAINSGAKESSSGISQIKTGIQTLNEAAHKLKEMV